VFAGRSRTCSPFGIRFGFIVHAEPAQLSDSTHNLLLFKFGSAEFAFLDRKNRVSRKEARKPSTLKTGLLAGTKSCNRKFAVRPGLRGEEMALLLCRDVLLAVSSA
jgi:hypothetical protein